MKALQLGQLHSQQQTLYRQLDIDVSGVTRTSIRPTFMLLEQRGMGAQHQAPRAQRVAANIQAIPAVSVVTAVVTCHQ